MNFGKIINQTIKIQASGNNGFLVTVGCGRFVYSDKKKLVEDLEEYLSDPKRFEAEYNKLNLGPANIGDAGSASLPHTSPHTHIVYGS